MLSIYPPSCTPPFPSVIRILQSMIALQVEAKLNIRTEAEYFMHPAWKEITKFQHKCCLAFSPSPPNKRFIYEI